MLTGIWAPVRHKTESGAQIRALLCQTGSAYGQNYRIHSYLSTIFAALAAVLAGKPLPENVL